MRKVLVYGLGVSGISTVKSLAEMDYQVYTYDKNKIEIEQLKGYNYSPISDSKIMDIDYDFVVKSPGIKPSDDLLVRLAEKYEIISDIELSYRLFPDKKFLAITGTNGKTSTTSMISHILNENGIRAISVGNIGEGILWQMKNNDAVFVEELSSFQLKDTSSYHPHIGAILNISPDHIDWHGSYEDYINSKFNIAKNQDNNDYLIINHEDEILSKNKDKFKANIYEFSSKREITKGLYLENDKIIFSEADKKIEVLDVKDLKIIGNHNYENLMAAILETYLFGLDFDQIAKASKTFVSIEHRLEFVDEVCGVKIYNDSKGTNVDSSIKAINSFTDPIIIIGGGYDKKIDYSDYVKAFTKNGKEMIILGETKEMLKDLCQKYSVKYKVVDDMDQAVRYAVSIAQSPDIILLSPASASWDMYDSYQTRGRDFKEKIDKYKGNIK
ncbi:UDP-N-acetylmuramoyl-L-alanine--D-glutamate ligase [Anaerococcus sp. Marseille-Q7828]|uniref:UDP-N-acetylmuramoyl-L-alanine--D-glutamate ligase n=1 Tax=Anaerococcus sp. Marseille-Q7828 TaxID=3036300 RepID=UPI0024AD79A3|nr:UDP-N-acetylmuramoyl-L-alanine--D-glutamate ligase [Anaerococcus sp. Marseille-Q7828]